MQIWIVGSQTMHKVLRKVWYRMQILSGRGLRRCHFFYNPTVDKHLIPTLGILLIIAISVFGPRHMQDHLV